MWFIGDSYGVHPYESFSGFGNICTREMTYMDSVCCMFGGLNFGIAYEYAAFNNLRSGQDIDLASVLESNLHANDTYGSSKMHSAGLDYLDLTSFDSEIVEGEQVHYLRNYMGMFCNATGLTKVRLSRTLGQSEEYFGSETIPFTYSYMFQGCESLKEVENLQFAKNQTKNSSLCIHMFDGCSSIESINLSQFSGSNVLNMG